MNSMSIMFDNHTVGVTAAEITSAYKNRTTGSCFTLACGVTVDNCGTVESRQPSGLGPSIESMKQNEVVGPQPGLWPDSSRWEILSFWKGQWP